MTQILMSEIKDIDNICKRLAIDLSSTVINSKLSMQNLRAEVKVEVLPKKVYFLRYLKRVHTEKIALAQRFCIKRKHFKTKYKLQFDRAEFIYNKLEEVKNEN